MRCLLFILGVGFLSAAVIQVTEGGGVYDAMYMFSDSAGSEMATLIGNSSAVTCSTDLVTGSGNSVNGLANMVNDLATRLLAAEATIASLHRDSICSAGGHSELSQTWRNVGNPNLGNGDNGAFTSHTWYRFTAYEGERVATSLGSGWTNSYDRCGTGNGHWLVSVSVSQTPTVAEAVSTNPSTADGIVVRKLCGSSNGAPYCGSADRPNVKVLNCGTFFVYQFISTEYPGPGIWATNGCSDCAMCTTTV